MKSKKDLPPIEVLEYEPPWMYAKQREAIFCPERYAIIEASTKSGKTTGCLIWLYEKALLSQSGRNFWWVAPIFPQAKIAFRRMKRGLHPESYTANESELTITLLNGAVIWFKGADKPDSLYGEDVYAAVIDEATRCKEGSWYAVRSTLTATRAPVRIIGNVKGRKNWCYHLARKAEGNEPGMRYTKLTAWDAVEGGVLAAEEVEDAKRTLPDAVFRELYLAEPSDDGGNPFGLKAIAECIGVMAPAKPVVWGIDVAKSQDWTVCIALDQSGHVCGFERFQKSWQDTIREIQKLTGRVPALVDSTGVGDPVLESLQALGTGHYEGFKFSSGSKQQLMEGLAVAIQSKAIRYPDGPIVSELESFEYEYTRTGARYSAPQGQHDDCVMALALAWRGLSALRGALPETLVYDDRVMISPY